MSRIAIAFLGALAVSAAVVSAHAAPQKSGSDRVFSGCLIPGPTANSYLLTAATEKGVKDKDKATFVVVAGSDKVNVGRYVTNAVEVHGSLADGNPPTISATKVNWKADYCG